MAGDLISSHRPQFVTVQGMGGVVMTTSFSSFQPQVAPGQKMVTGD
jgi:hypothetical protein